MKMFANSICIAGKTATGTTTLFKGLKALKQLNELPYRWFSGGDNMRVILRKYNEKHRTSLSIEQFTKLNAKDPNFTNDRLIDGMTAAFALQDYTVTEGRIPYLFMPRSYKAHIFCSDDVLRAKRRLKQMQEKDPSCPFSWEEILERILERDRDDEERFRRMYEKTYGPGMMDPEFDLEIDTKEMSPDEVVQNLLDGHKGWVDRLGPDAFEQGVVISSPTSDEVDHRITTPTLTNCGSAG